jgi:hypothetical protein
MENALLDSLMEPHTGINVATGRLVLTGKEMLVDFLRFMEGAPKSNTEANLHHRIRVYTCPFTKV